MEKRSNQARNTLTLDLAVPRKKFLIVSSLEHQLLHRNWRFAFPHSYMSCILNSLKKTSKAERLRCKYGRRKGGAGGEASLDFEVWYFLKTLCWKNVFSFSFELVKWHFTTVGPPLKKCFWPPPGKIHCWPPWKKFFWRLWLQVRVTIKSYGMLLTDGNHNQQE